MLFLSIYVLYSNVTYISPVSCLVEIKLFQIVSNCIANKELRLCCCIQRYPQVANISKLDLMPNFYMSEKVFQQECAIDYLVSKYTFMLINQFIQM